MGWHKQREIELESRGYGEPPKKNVCSRHIDDHYIVKFIEEKSTKGVCDYCEKKTAIISTGELIGFIGQAINEKYTDPANEMYCESSLRTDIDDIIPSGYNTDYGYAAPENKSAMEADELFEDIGLEIDSEQLYNDLLDCFNHQLWCVKDPYGMTTEEELSFMWTEFLRMVKHSRRFTFFKASEFQLESPHPRSENGLFDILTEIASAAHTCNLIKTIPVKTSIFRGQVHETTEKVDTFKRIASPPDNKASNNRMSPAGISMFYGAFDAITAQAEIEDADLANTNTTVGEFVNTKELKIVNFNYLPSTSFFGTKNLETYSFLRSFAYEISRPIDPNAKERDYVPTQIITEYFRYVFRLPDGQNIHGLIYKSSKTGRDCLVLFFNEKMCPDFLKLIGHKIIR